MNLPFTGTTGWHCRSLTGYWCRWFLRYLTRLIWLIWSWYILWLRDRILRNKQDNLLYSGPDLRAGTAQGPHILEAPTNLEFTLCIPYYLQYSVNNSLSFLVVYVTSRIVQYLKRLTLIWSLFTLRFVLNHALYLTYMGPFIPPCPGPHMAKSGPASWRSDSGNISLVVLDTLLFVLWKPLF